MLWNLTYFYFCSSIFLYNPYSYLWFLIDIWWSNYLILCWIWTIHHYFPFLTISPDWLQYLKSWNLLIWFCSLSLSPPSILLDVIGPYLDSISFLNVVTPFLTLRHDHCVLPYDNPIELSIIDWIYILISIIDKYDDKL